MTIKLSITLFYGNQM